MRLAESIRTDIAEGRLKHGDRLPTEAQLIELHQVSRITVREALQVLLQIGLIERFAGRGSFVTQASSVPAWTIESIDDVIRLSPTFETTLVSWRPVSPHAEIANFLQTGTGKAYLMRGVRKRGGKPLHFIEIYTPSSIGERLNQNDFHNRTVIEIIETTLKLKVTRAVEEISATTATGPLARMLRVKLGSPLLLQDIKFFGQNHQPLEWSRIWWRADDFKRRNILARSR
jgi:DNA-binding GntR family transcriptional regulator